MRDGLALLAGRFSDDLLEESKVHEAAFSREGVARAHDTLGVAVIRILDHQHGWQRKVKLVVRIKQEWGLGQPQKELGLRVSDIEDHQPRYFGLIRSTSSAVTSIERRICSSAWLAVMKNRS